MATGPHILHAADALSKANSLFVGALLMNVNDFR